MNLKNLMVDTKAVWVDFPGLTGFTVEVANLSRKELTKIRKKCTTQKFDRKTRVAMDTLDEEKFVVEFAKATVKNGKGLTLEHLEPLILIHIGDKNPKEKLEYTVDNAEILVNSSSEFDQWLNEVVFDLDNFRTGRKDGADKKTGKVSGQSRLKDDEGSVS